MVPAGSPIASTSSAAMTALLAGDRTKWDPMKRLTSPGIAMWSVPRPVMVAESHDVDDGQIGRGTVVVPTFFECRQQSLGHLQQGSGPTHRHGRRRRDECHRVIRRQHEVVVAHHAGRRMQSERAHAITSPPQTLMHSPVM